MCFSSSSTSKNTELAKKYGKKIPANMDETPIYFASGFSFPSFRIVTKEDVLQTMNWGLIPSWFKDSDYKEIASMTLNARVETVDEKASYRHLIHRQECIVPFTGFYEWQTKDKQKIPYFVYPADGNIMSVAGLFDNWQDPLSGIIKQTFTIITCPANDLMAEIHNSKKRMPVLLKQDQENDWLNGKLDIESISIPVDSSFIKAHEVDRKIISGKNRNIPEVQIPFHNSFSEQTSMF